MPDYLDFQDHSATPVAVQPAAQRTPGWVAPAALVIAVVAVALAVWSIFTGSADPSADRFGADGGDPKTRVCSAFDTVSQAVPLQTNNNLGNDPVAVAAVAGNARLALLGGGFYLENSISSDTPSDLADPVRRFAINLQEIGMNALAGLPMTDATQTTLAAQGEQTRKQISDLCR